MWRRTKSTVVFKSEPQESQFFLVHFFLRSCFHFWYQHKKAGFFVTHIGRFEDFFDHKHSLRTKMSKLEETAGDIPQIFCYIDMNSYENSFSVLKIVNQTPGCQNDRYLIFICRCSLSSLSSLLVKNKKKKTRLKNATFYATLEVALPCTYIDTKHGPLQFHEKILHSLQSLVENVPV